MNPAPSVHPLKLYKATSFWRRLCGLHAYSTLPWHTGLYIAPCHAIHTFGLSYAIDVVFLDASHRICMLRHSMPPWRWAHCPDAVAVVEFPSGYCLADPDFHRHLLAALGMGR